MNGFELRRQRKQESIKQSAARLFAQNGVDKVTVQEIAAEANVSYATIFKYFKSKQDLAFEVVRWTYEKAYRELENILKSDRPFLERVEAMMLQKSDSLDHVNFSLIKQAFAYDPDEITRVDTSYEEKKKHLYTQFFEEGRRKGFIHPDVSTDAIMLHRNALRALVLSNPRILTELEHNRDLLKGYMQILQFGIMGTQRLPHGETKRSHL